MSVTTLYDRRKSQRTRTFLKGVIRHSSKLSTMDCMIKNLSDAGARVEVNNTSWLPDSFELEVVNRGIRCKATTAWRANGVAGIHFPPQTAESLAREELNHLRRERATLERRLRDVTE